MNSAIPARRQFPRPARSSLWFFLGLSVSTGSLHAQGTDRPATISGVVASRGIPVAEVEITVLGRALSVLTDSAGRFRLTGVPPGLTVLRVRRIGYKGQYLRTTLEAATTLETDIELEPGAYFLPEIEVSAKAGKPLEFAWTTKYDDFFRRRNYGLPGGTFVSAEDIRRQPAMHTAELLEHHVPNLRVVNHFLGPGGTEIKFPRCSDHVGVWVDGRKLNWQSKYQQTPGVSLTAMSQRSPGGDQKAREKAAELADVLEQVNPSEIQFMEVYRGIGSMPGEFGGGCGAIVIWTK
jgi:carboxypeptidase family protein